MITDRGKLNKDTGILKESFCLRHFRELIYTMLLTVFMSLFIKLLNVDERQWSGSNTIEFQIMPLILGQDVFELQEYIKIYFFFLLLLYITRKDFGKKKKKKKKKVSGFQPNFENRFRK